jgi:hypothetical protein
MASSRWEIVPPEEAPPSSKWEVVPPPEIPADETAAVISAAEAAALRTQRSVKSDKRTPAWELTPEEKQMQALVLGGINSATFGMGNRALAVADYLGQPSPTLSDLVTGKEAPSYANSLKKVTERDAKLSEDNPWTYGLGSVLGGVGTGAGLARGGLTLAKEGAKWGPRLAANALEGIGWGTIGGAGTTYTGKPEDYARNAVIGGTVGGVVGAAATPVISAARWAGEKIAAPFRRLRPDADVAAEHVARAARDAGKTTEQIRDDVTNAYMAQQPTYSTVDAIGDPAQRKLAGVAKQPGPGRTEVKEFIKERNIDYPARVGGEIDRALGVDETAALATEKLIKKAQVESSPAYQKAMAHPVWNDTLAEAVQNPDIKKGIAAGIKLQQRQNALTGKPFNPTDPAIVGFDEAGDPIIKGVPNMTTWQSAKEGLDSMIEKEIDAVTGKVTKTGAALIGMKNRLLETLDALNPHYAEARRLYAGPMEVKNAVSQGKSAAAMNRRHADTTRGFRDLGDTEQQGFRIGYADAVGTKLEAGQRPPLLAARVPKGVNELEAFQLYQGPTQPGRPGPLRQFLNREEVMHDTGNKAVGGSSTAENIADFADTPGMLEDAAAVIGPALRGQWGTAIGAAASKTGAALRGESESQRAAIARLLMSNQTTPELFSDMLRRIEEVEAKRRAAAYAADAVARGTAGAATTGPWRERGRTSITVNPRPGYYGR